MKIGQFCSFFVNNYLLNALLTVSFTVFAFRRIHDTIELPDAISTEVRIGIVRVFFGGSINMVCDYIILL